MIQTVLLRRMYLLLAALLLLALQPCESNAAKYPLDYRWMTWKQGDVSVYYPRGYETYARYIANRAFVHLDTLDTWYDVRPTHTRIVLHPAHDRGMAFATVLPLRMETSLTPVLDKGLRPQGGLYLDRVTAHELTHVVQFSTVAGITKPARWIFGDAVAPVGISPDWFTEGQAIYTESIQGGGRLNSPYHQLLFRAPLIEGKLWSLDQIATPGEVAPVASRAYVAGSFLYADLHGEYQGQARAAHWMRNQAKWVGFQHTAFTKTFRGRDAQTVYTDLRDVWREDLRDLMRIRGRVGYAVGNRVLAAPRTGWRRPVWVNGDHVAVIEQSYDHPAKLVLLSGKPLAERPERSFEIGSTSDEEFTPFGDGFLLSRIRRGTWAPEETRSVIVRVDAQGNEHDIATSGLHGWSPVYHAASGQLAYITRTEAGALALKRVNISDEGELGGEPETLLETSLGMFSDLSWDQAGKRIALTVDMGQGETVVVLTPASGRLQEVRIDSASTAWDPCFSPRGTIWLSAAVDGIYDLFEVDPEFDWAVRRTRCLTGAMEPAVSPDGSQIVYSHYTSEGFSLAQLDSTRWANEVVDVTIADINTSEFFAPDSLLLTESFLGKAERYHVTQHLRPIFWMPAAGGSDEDAFGVYVMGRDPLGLLTWSGRALYGSESGLPGGNFDVTWRGWAFDMSAGVEVMPNAVTEYQGFPDSSSGFIQFYPSSSWKQEIESQFLVHQSFRRDRGPWAMTTTPFVGLTQRQRYPLVRAGNDLLAESAWYHGIRGGLDWYEAYGAARDPVARHLVRVTVSGERYLPGISDIESDVVEGHLRYNMPLFIDNYVLMLGVSAQRQNGPLNYSRSTVLPRGIEESDLSSAMLRTGNLGKGSIAVRFPLFFPDHGLGMGWAFLKRVDGTLFVEGATGWGGDRSLTDWLEKDGVASFGAELSLGGWVLYDAALDFHVGYAFRSAPADGVIYFGTSLPNLVPGLLSDTPRVH